MQQGASSSGSTRWRRRQRSRLASLALLLALAVSTSCGRAAADDAQVDNEDVHVVFLTDCTSYSDWQTLGMVFSWRESGQVRGKGWFVGGGSLASPG